MKKKILCGLSVALLFCNVSKAAAPENPIVRWAICVNDTFSSNFLPRAWTFKIEFRSFKFGLLMVILFFLAQEILQ